ncbi:MAG: glucosidase, partial [Candidatus Dormibacteraeota bacterium]|nr:glucosidase [Candidatus Dormibacteraeota bacterium]
PTHSWMRWRYAYPQAAYPYEQLLAQNRARGNQDPEFELLDTGAFEADRYFEITADYAKADPEDLLLEVTVRNAGPEPAAIDVIPTLWFRNTWAWGRDPRKPSIGAAQDGPHINAEHWQLGRRALSYDGAPDLLFCDNETNTGRLWNAPNPPRHPKDAIHDHVVHGLDKANPERTGTKVGLRYHLTLEAGGSTEVRIRLAPDAAATAGPDFENVMKTRAAEADEFYAGLAPGLDEDRARVMRQAFAGMLWSKQFYHYDVRAWLQGDPAGPPPPPERRQGRNADWLNLDNRDVISMPDTWEYPWYAAWDLGFHCVTLAHVDPEFAKSQLILLCREWFMHPSGQLPAYEWAFGDVNPPVHAWAALRVYHVDGARDVEFLERVFHKLLLNFTWWVNRKDVEGNNVFQGGFLGLDNIGPFDRSAVPPEAGHLEQSDGTAWMAMYCLNLLEVALELARHDRTYEDIATKFFEHFTLIALAINDQGLWDEEDGFYYDVLHLADGSRTPLRARSIVGLIPLVAVTVLDGELRGQLHDFSHRMDWYLHSRPDLHGVVEHVDAPGHQGRYLLSILSPDRLRRLLARMLDETEFLSPHGLRALSRWHRQHPLEVDLGGMRYTLDYEPGESTSGLFGGNSNWRGPLWFPINYLMIGGLRRFHAYLGDDFQVECPTGSGRTLNLLQVADEIGRRLEALVLDDNGRRPVFGDEARFQSDPAWHSQLLFYEYFHGDTGAGLGASHQTGWTGLVADIIASRGPLNDDSGGGAGSA